MTVPADTVLFSENTPCQGFPLVLDGEVKVSLSSGDGRSLEKADYPAAKSEVKNQATVELPA